MDEVMRIFRYIKRLFSRSKKNCIECNHFENLDDSIITRSDGFCGELKVAVYKNDIEDCFKIKNTLRNKDTYAPRGKNTPYPNDEFAENHIRQWLEDIYWKHHG